MLRGSITALVTPFKDGQVDEDALGRLVDWQIAEGTHGLAPCGTTGESPTLSTEEHMRVVEVVVEAVAGRVPVVAGAGSNNTAEAVHYMQHCKAVGADAALVVTPYYNKPTQRGLIQHFQACHDAADLPIVIYNIPGRSVIDMAVETMAELARLPRIIGVKDATGDIVRVSEQRAACGTDFIQLSGEDASALGFNAHGGAGCISVSSNVAPRLCAEFQEKTLSGDFAGALEIQDRLMPLHEAVFTEPGTVGAKTGLAILGHCERDVRSPLTSALVETENKVRAAMVHAGLING